MRVINTVISCLAITIFFLSNIVIASNSTIEGYAKDAKTGEPLYGTIIMLLGTGMGNAADMDGRYVIPNVPPGTYNIRASYIGYKTQTIEISVKEGTKIKHDFNLEPVGIEGETIVITAQAMGQSQAINQQLSSNQIINVVSAAKIQELPDANAAESVGRLPGIFVLRSGGEGNAVSIRGLQPKFNKVMIDGVEMSSANPNDRGTDLSSISSNMLEGIQVSKTVTADMPADVFGGTVNFQLREAKVKQSGVAEFSILTQGSYNNLSNALNKFNNYKYVIGGENRYLEDRLGIFAQVDIERKNLSGNQLGASYGILGNNYIDYVISDIGLSDGLRDRQRYNVALVIDYRLPEGKIKLSNFVTTGNTHIQTRSEGYSISGNTHTYSLTNTKSTGTTITNALSFEHQLSIFQIDAKLSHTYSESKDPYDWGVSYYQGSADLTSFINKTNLNPIDIPKASFIDLDKTYLTAIYTNGSFSRDRAIMTSLDLKTNINFSDLISAEIKFGGMYRYQTRSFDSELYNGGGLQFADAAFSNDLIISHFGLPPGIRYNISLPYFMDPNYDYGKFLGGDYKMGAAIDFGMAAELADLFKNNAALIAANHNSAVYSYNSFLSQTSDYSGKEKLSAFYVMTILNVGPQITIIPGVRYQNLQTIYTGVQGVETRYSFTLYDHIDTTITRSHGYWLPNISLRYKPFTWFDVRLSYTNTLSYPDFYSIIPRIHVGSSIAWNNVDLAPQRSKNYDISLSFYENTIGLFTVGGFLKQIKDLIYGWTFYVSGENARQYWPANKQAGASIGTSTYAVGTSVNNSQQVDDYGVELDWQTHFWYLPGPLSGLVFSANYTHIFSKAHYPYTKIVPGKDSRSRPTYVDTSYTDRLLYQPNDVVNFALGFDYKDFMIRLSMLYSANIYASVNFWPQLRANTTASTRWDLSVKQRLPWFGIQIYGNLNNISKVRNVSVIQASTGVPLSEQDYGLTADVGLRWNF